MSRFLTLPPDLKGKSGSDFTTWWEKLVARSAQKTDRGLRWVSLRLMHLSTFLGHRLAHDVFWRLQANVENRGHQRYMERLMAWRCVYDREHPEHPAQDAATAAREGVAG